MDKDFARWHAKKREIHNKELGGDLYFKTREVWWCSLGLNVGYEEDGKNDGFLRPILILKVFNRDVLWILPMTSKDKVGKYYYRSTYQGKKFSIILSQLRLISSKRLLRKIRTLPYQEFNEVKECMRELI